MNEHHISTPIEILESDGPLRLGAFTIGGGLALWVRRVELTWRHDGILWDLQVLIVTRLPDRFDSNVPVNVCFTRSYAVLLDPDGRIRNGRRGETDSTWVAHRIFETLLWMVEHEVAESVRLDGNFLVDAHAEEPTSRP